MNTNRLLALFFLFFFSCSLFSQNLPVNERTGKVSYRNVVQVDGFSASDLYKKAKEWFSVNTGESLNDKLISPNQYISFDNQSPFITSGIRIGSAAITTRGMLEKDMDKIVEYIDKAIVLFQNKKSHSDLSRNINTFMKQFPIFKY